MKQWCIVQFGNGDTEVVPRSWVQEDKVFWPPYPLKDTAKVRAAIKRRDEPCEGWQTFTPVRVLISRAPASTTPQAFHSLQPPSSSSPMGYQFLQSPAMLPFAEDFPAMAHLAQMPGPLQPGPTPFQGLSPEDVALQKLLAMVTELSSEVKELRKEFRVFQQSFRCCQPVGVVGQLVALADGVEMPIRSLEEFDHAEASLQTPEACKAMVTRLLVVGGTSLESRVRRVLSLVLTNEVASALNWAGKKMKEEQKQKRAFKHTKICKCIYDALTQQLGASMDDYAFGQAVQKWLRYAPDRDGGTGRGGAS
ncbi:hypothetical protein ACEWY4_023571 [Coilia grayii]|uniref:DUF4806 domain-containing protein n=1 Tax=Coilia grayii TaxID=363190 RepID=A0ABD1J3G0_9TELE